MTDGGDDRLYDSSIGVFSTMSNEAVPGVTEPTPGLGASKHNDFAELVRLLGDLTGREPMPEEIESARAVIESD